MLRIIFAGTPAFALPSLEKLRCSGHPLVAILTRPDQPAGRGRHLTISPVKALAERYKLPLYQPVSLKEAANQQLLRDLKPDLLVNVAYGALLPEAVLNIPRLGCINLHPSLLPRWRGAAPIQRAILAGDEITAVTIMAMDKGLDTGAIYAQQLVSITQSDTTATLAERLAEQGAQLLETVIAAIAAGTANPIPQTDEGVTYAAKLTKEEGRIDWLQPAAVIARKIRALYPWPGSFFYENGDAIKIIQALPCDTSALGATHPPAAILKVDHAGILVATGQGGLNITQLHLPGGNKPISVAELLNAKPHWFYPGKILTT